MGVCCIVFDIDGMLLEFFMNFLNIEKKNVEFFSSKFHVSSCFMLFPTLKKKLVYKFFLHFMLFPTFPEKINSGNKKQFIFILEKQ